MAQIKNTHELDLSSVRGFIATAEWMRRNILLAEPDVQMLQLNVMLSRGDSAEKKIVAIFLDTSSAYVIGFRGKGKVFVLGDAGQCAIAKLRTAQLIGPNEKPEVLKRIETGHRSLGTFQRRDGVPGMRGSVYHLANLQNAAKLADFSGSDTGPVTYDDVRSALSILVCMIAESARSNLILRNFERLYFGESVEADDVVQYYDNAKRILGYAYRIEKRRVMALTDRIEKLEKRAKELFALWASVQAHAEKKEFFRLAIAGAAPQNPPNMAEAAIRVQQIANELDGASADDLCDIMSLCSKPTALRAARGGIIAPIPIPIP